MKWKEKMEKKDLPKIVEVPEKWKKIYGEGKMVIPAPKEVMKIMEKIPKGKVITVKEIREILAKKHGVNIACPLTTGIFIWIVANMAEEEKKNIPYWRTLKSNGQLNEKYPGGVDKQREKLEEEGHKIVKKGKKYVVVDYEKKLFIPTPFP